MATFYNTFQASSNLWTMLLNKLYTFFLLFFKQLLKNLVYFTNQQVYA